MKRIAGRIGPRLKSRGKRAQWGDWRPFNAAPIAWDSVGNFITGAQVISEIAGRALSAGSIPTVPFDPGTQLAGGTVTLVEEETFEVQVAGFIEVWGSSGPGFLDLYWGLYLGDYVNGSGFYCPPLMNVAIQAADTDWKQYENQAGILFPLPATVTTKVNPTRLRFAATQRIGQGKGLMLAVLPLFTNGTFSYASYIKYRIRRNVD
jgi:hypothetical protein